MPESASVLSVNLVHALIADSAGSIGRTAIDKRPAAGPVVVDAYGLYGDTVLDHRHHGGPDKALYAYAAEDVDWWSAELGRVVTPGQFGENLTTRGVDVTGAVIGERWRIGPSVVVEVSMPRTPCTTFQAWMGEPHWVKRFTEHGAPGAYLRVVEDGQVEAGQRVEVLDRPVHGVTVGEVFAGRSSDPERLSRLLDEPGLAEDLVAALRKVLGIDAIVRR